MAAIFDLPGWKTTKFNEINYHYVHVKPGQPSKPTIVCFHGAPTGLMAYRKIVPKILSSGYGIVLIELPGFGGTDKPADLAHYSRVTIAQSAAGILDAEGLDQVVILAHDWGTFVGSAFSLQFSERVLGLILVGIPFFEPKGQAFPAAMLNESYFEALGYEPFAYQVWFVEDKEAPTIIANHLEAFVTAWFADDLGHECCARDVLKTKLLADTKTSCADWAKQEDVDETVAFLAKNDMNAIMNWYRFPLTYADEKELTMPKHLEVPFLFLECTKDAVVPPGLDAGHRERCDDLTTKSFDAGHWLLEQDTDGAWSAIEEFLAVKGVVETLSGEVDQGAEKQRKLWLWDSSSMRWLRQKAVSDE